MHGQKNIKIYIHFEINISEVSDVYCIVRQFDTCVSCKRL